MDGLMRERPRCISTQADITSFLLPDFQIMLLGLCWICICSHSIKNNIAASSVPRPSESGYSEHSKQLSYKRV